jgi:Zn-finger nucleic acid-binding protein
MIEAEERNDIRPMCPHCKIEITKVLLQRVSSVFGKRYLYFCPHCRAVLGVSHRKGFWMG